MPRVLILCEYGSLNGGEQSLLAVLDGVRAAGFQVDVGAPPDGPLARVLAERQIRLVPLPLHDRAGRRCPLPACRQLIRAALDSVRPDLVHANSLSMSRLTGPVVAELGLPSLGHLRDIVGVNQAAIADLNRHSRLLAVSQATRDWYVSAGLAADRLQVLLNGVDLARFQPRPADGFLARELGLSPTAPLVGTIGQIGMRKGLHSLALAAQRVVQDVPAAQFVVVGRRYSDKPEAHAYEAELQRLAVREPLAGHFHFLGLRDDVDRLLNEFTILAHAARQEPLGRVLLEAAAAGVPVVATAVGGTREIFPDDETAVLVPVDDAPALAAALVALLRSPARQRQLSAAARRRATVAFDAQRAAAGLAAHYWAVLGGQQ